MKAQSPRGRPRASRWVQGVQHVAPAADLVSAAGSFVQDDHAPRSLHRDGGLKPLVGALGNEADSQPQRPLLAVGRGDFEARPPALPAISPSIPSRPQQGQQSRNPTEGGEPFLPVHPQPCGEAPALSRAAA